MTLALDCPLELRLPGSGQWTDEQFFDFCQANPELQIERDAEGNIIIMAPSGFDSSRQEARVVQLLGDWSDTDGRGVVTGPTGGFTLPSGAMRAPDAAWISREQIESLSTAERQHFPHLVPPFIIEIASPTDRLGSLQRKMEEWRDAGVQLGWLLQPATRTIWIYRADEDRAERQQDPRQVAGEGAVAGFVLDLSRVWGATGG